MEKVCQDFLAGKEKGKHRRLINPEWHRGVGGISLFIQEWFLKGISGWSLGRILPTPAPCLCILPCRGGFHVLVEQHRNPLAQLFSIMKNGDFPKVPSSTFPGSNLFVSPVRLQRRRKTQLMQWHFFDQFCTWTSSVLLCSFGKGITVLLQEHRGSTLLHLQHFHILRWKLTQGCPVMW